MLEKMMTDITCFDFTNVEFTGHDVHAWYFLADDLETGKPCTVKVEKSDRWVWFKEEDQDDWNLVDTI